MNCQQVQEDVSVALLMRQPVDAEVRAHLELCPTCANDAARLAPLSELLAAAEPTALAGTAPRPEALDRLLAEAARRAHRSRGRWLAAVAAAMVLAIPLGIFAAHREAPTVATRQVERSASDPVTGVSATVKVWPADFGSSVRVTLTGVAAGTKCTLSVVNKDGTRQTAATWWATYQGAASVDGSVAASITDIDRLEVLDASGKLLLPVSLG